MIIRVRLYSLLADKVRAITGPGLVVDVGETLDQFPDVAIQIKRERRTVSDVTKVGKRSLSFSLREIQPMAYETRIGWRVLSGSIVRNTPNPAVEAFRAAALYRAGCRPEDPVDVEYAVASEVMEYLEPAIRKACAEMAAS